MVTVKQLADQLNVTKATVFNNARALELKLMKIDNVVDIDEEQAKLIAERILDNKHKSNMLNKVIERDAMQSDKTLERMINSKIDKKIDKQIDNVQSESDEIIKLLNKQIERLEQDKSVFIEQLSVKDQQISNLNTTLNEQQRLLSQQQSLQLESKEHIKVLESTIDDLQKDKDRASQHEKEADRANNSASNVSFVKSVFRMLRR